MILEGPDGIVRRQRCIWDRDEPRPGGRHHLRAGSRRRAGCEVFEARPAGVACGETGAMTAHDVLPTRRATPTRRAVKGQIRGDRTRQLVIDETIRCVREEGFAAISASRIAERADDESVMTEALALAEALLPELARARHHLLAMDPAAADGEPD